jgi:hypothetical protein
MKNQLFFFFAFIIFLFGFSCKKQSIPATAKNATLYFAGADGNKAVYWKNGSEYTLPSTNGARVSSIPVSGTDVYFAGFEGTGPEVSFPSPAVYWKDGVKFTIPYLNSILDSNSDNFLSLDLVSNIAFSGTNLYIGGTAGSRAIYWLNGVKHMLPGADPVNGGSYVNDMFLSGPDLYLAGYDSGNLPSFWKNGVETILPLADTVKYYPGNPFYLGEVSRIYVSGPDVYCAGIDGWTLAYWKNGVEHTLPVMNPEKDPNSTGGTSGIALSGTDLYITGVDGKSAVYWKNGIENKLPSNGQAYAAGVAFIGTDVYIVGTDNVNPVYWKNGIENSLPCVNPGNSVASAIAVANQ